MPEQQQPPLAERVWGSAVNLAGRRAGLLILSGVGAAAVTRLLGPSDYGQYASAIATWALLGAAADFGFTLMLSRDLATTDPAEHRGMLRAAYQVGTAWSLLLVVFQVGLALTAGLSTDRGIALLVLAPSLAFSGLVVARVPFMVQYRTRTLVLIDLPLTTVVVTAQVATAALALGAVGVAAASSLGAILTQLLVMVAAARLLAGHPSLPFARIALVRRAAPLGLLGVMTRVYLMIDLVLLGWLVSGPRLGDYAAAAKMLMILTSVTALVVDAALPAFASQARAAVELDRLVARVWHWLVVSAFPIYVLTALFAPLAIRVTVGPDYESSASLLRILALAGAIAVMSNLLGILMIATNTIRTLFVQTGAAIALNVAGNLLLVPRIGVAAAAWMTVATEALVCGGAVLVLARRIDFRLCVAVSRRPLVALAVTTAIGVALIDVPAIGLPVTALVFVGTLTLLRGWPAEFRPRRLLGASTPDAS